MDADPASRSLIVVPGHAAFKDSVAEVPGDPAADEYWVLQSFQAGEPPYYLENIRAGVDLAAKDPGACLMFSGGRTRQEAGHWSEAATYAAIAQKYADSSVLPRIKLETYARDSLENLQFSLAHFRQLFGTYPRHVTVVGWEFKRERFMLHCLALGWNPANFDYVGCNNPADLAGAEAGERKTLAQFKSDPLGQHNPLHAKRLERDPFHQTLPYSNLL